MKQLITILVFIGFSVNFAFAQEQDCRSLRVGKFRLDDASVGIRTLIERTETEQTETNLDTGETIKGSIQWVDDCTYIFTYLETSSKDEVVKSFIGQELIVEITKIEGDKISFTCTIKDYEYKSSFFMKRIE